MSEEKHEEKILIKKVFVIGTPEWMMSYGDLMSCLLVFFVLLLTFSSSKPDKLMDMMGEYIGPGGNEESQDLGDTTGAAGASKRIAVDPEDESAMKLANLIVSQKYRDFKERLYKMGFKNDISYTQTEDGFYIETAESNVLDAKGELLPDAAPLLQAMANAAISVRKELRILEILGGGGPGEAIQLSATARAERNASTICGYMRAKYQIKGAKLSFGVSFSKEPGAKIRFFVADGIEGKALTLSELNKQGS